MPALTARQQGRTIAASAAVGIAVTLVSWLRLDPTTRGTVWAEDGVFFYWRHVTGRPLTTVLDPYEGYLHVLPRLLVELAMLAPVQKFAVLATALSCAVVRVVAALVFVCSRSVVRSAGARLALSAVPALVPAAPLEVLGNVANLHWYLLWLTPWLLLARPQRWWQGVGLAVLALLTTLSEIQAALFLPLVLVYPRDRKRYPLAVAFLVGVAVQVMVALDNPRPNAGGPSAGAADVLKGFLFNVVLPLWHPSIDGPGEVFASYGWPIALLELLPFVLALGALAVLTVRSRRSAEGRRGAGSHLLLLAVLVFGSVAPFVAGLVLNFQAAHAYGAMTPAALADVRPLRYGVVPAMFLLATVVVLADRLLERRRPARPAAAALLVLVLAVGALSFSPATRRSVGPTWAPGVARAEALCRSDDTIPSVHVPIAPRGAGWQVALSCEAFRAG